MYQIPTEPGHLVQCQCDFFLWVEKYFNFSSTVTFAYNMFVVCEINIGLVLMVSYVVSFTDVFVLECVLVVSYFLLAT